MQTIIDFFGHITDPTWIMQNGGLYIVILIVFIETGFPFGFFLPGDSLLFIAGMVIANALAPFDAPFVNLIFWILAITAAGILGNFVGYWIGRKSDGLLLHRKDSWFFKKKYLIQAKEFYDKKGGGAILLARFLPLVRTFAPIVAGLVKMNAGKFAFYNIVGSFLWVASLVSAGFLLGENLWVKDNLEKIIIGIVLITTVPVILKMVTGKKNKNLSVE
ncbi:MAG: DedA family protein [Bacteroidia bacterium]|nr:MAG: DedA family protein [Bacteroidia bacterium]